MIETLHELAQSAGLERIAINVQSKSDSRVAVTIQSVLGGAPKDANQEQSRLRAALAQPLLIEGLPGEVDARLDGLLTAYVRDVRPQADRLITNTEKAAEGVKEAGSAASNNTSEASDDDTADGEATAATESDSDFASDDADSL